MTSKLNRRAYEQLIREDIAAMETVRERFVCSELKLEWEHIVDVLRASVEREYGAKESRASEVR